MIKIRSMCVALNLFCFGHFFPIPKISTPAKVIVAAIHSARATAAKLKIMDRFMAGKLDGPLSARVQMLDADQEQEAMERYLKKHPPKKRKNVRQNITI